MKEETWESYHQRMNRVLAHIAGHLDEPLDLKELAGLACFSPYHFHRVFKGMVGESLAGYIRRLRLERAAWLLRYGQKSVTDIALEAGYESLESFIRAFKSRFNLPPSCYRNLSRPEGKDEPPPGRKPLELKPGKEVAMQVDIRSQKPIPVAYVSHVGPYDQCMIAWEKLCAWAGPKGLMGPQARFLGLCHDDPEVTPPDKIRYDACLAVPDKIEPEGEIGVKQVPGGDYAVTLHKGPYEKLSETYAELCGGWLPNSGRELASRPSIEVYLNDPASVSPEELLVEVMVPLE